MILEVLGSRLNVVSYFFISFSLRLRIRSDCLINLKIGIEMIYVVLFYFVFKLIFSNAKNLIFVPDKIYLWQNSNISIVQAYIIVGEQCKPMV